MPNHEVVAINAASNRSSRSRRQLRRDEHAVGLFVVETKVGDGCWLSRSTRKTARAAQACAWDILTREGGEVRVRQGRDIVAEGVACDELDSVKECAGK